MHQILVWDDHHTKAVHMTEGHLPWCSNIFQSGEATAALASSGLATEQITSQESVIEVSRQRLRGNGSMFWVCERAQTSHIYLNPHTQTYAISHRWSPFLCCALAGLCSYRIVKQQIKLFWWTSVHRCESVDGSPSFLDPAPTSKPSFSETQGSDQHKLRLELCLRQ